MRGVSAGQTCGGLASGADVGLFEGSESVAVVRFLSEVPQFSDPFPFSRDEATSLLDQVRANVSDTAVRAAVTSVVNDAPLAYHDDQLVNKWRVIDPLLDIRLVLSGGRTGQSLP